MEEKSISIIPISGERGDDVCGQGGSWQGQGDLDTIS